MAEYIEREALLKKIREEGINQAEQYAERYHPVVMVYGHCFGLVKNAPAADVVEVGNCEGCAYSNRKRPQKCSCCRRNRDMKDCYVPKERRKRCD